MGFFLHLTGQAVHTPTGRAGTVHSPSLLLLHRARTEPGTVFGTAHTGLFLGLQQALLVDPELLTLLTQP